MNGERMSGNALAEDRDRQICNGYDRSTDGHQNAVGMFR
jgi:hypothetical protein